MIAVTPATDISKAPLASFVTSKPLDLHGQSDEKIDGCRDLVGAGELGVSRPRSQILNAHH